MNGYDNEEFTRRYQDAVLEAFREVFGVNQSEIIQQNDKWTQWVKGRKPKFGDLIEHHLKDSQMSDLYKARMVEVVLAPSLHISLFANPWDFQNRFQNYAFYWRDADGELPIKIWQFIAHILPICIEISQETKWHSEITQDNCEILPLVVYAKLLNEILSLSRYHYENSGEPILADEVVEKIFLHWMPTDPIPYNFSLCRQSSYGPYRDLMTSEAPNHWKERADAVMRDRVRKELSGQAMPRIPHENAPSAYRHTFERMYPHNMDKVTSIALAAEQVKLLLSPDFLEKAECPHHSISRVFLLLSQSGEYGDLCKWIVQRLIVDEVRLEFGVFRFDGETCAEMEAAMITACDPGDISTIEKIQTMAQACKDKCDARRRRQEKVKSAVEAVDALLH